MGGQFMPRTETVLQVFVASPGDVFAEREALEAVIRELNQTWSQSFNVRFDLVRWETHAYPAFGEDAQDVINRQIPNNYDVFVGIMWARYGSPTGRAGSGTVEEFERALERYKANPHTVHLMVYFKDAPVSPSAIDPGQLSKVHEFKQRVGAEGGLHWTFKDLPDFEALVRLHLSRYVQSWIAPTDAPEGDVRVMPSDAVEAESDTSNQVVTAEDDVGFLDIVERTEDAFATLTQVGERIATAANELGELIDLRAKEMDRAKGVGSQADYKLMKRATNRAAEHMDQFIARMKVEIPIFSQSYEEAIKGLGQAASLATDFSTEDTEDIDTALAGLIAVVNEIHNSLSVTRHSITGFRDSVSAAPRLTTAFNRSKRNTVAILDEFLAEVDAATSLTLEAQEALQSLLDRSSKPDEE